MKKYLFLLVLLCSASFMIAQTKSELQLGVTFPNGDFGDDDEDDSLLEGGKSGGAATGFSLNYKLLSPFGNVESLHWTFSAGIFYNDLNGDWKDELEEIFDDADDFTLPKYLNIPVMAGLQYEKTVTGTTALYGEAGLGINILKATSLSAEMRAGSNRGEIEQTFDLSTGFAFKLGAGFVFNDTFTVGLTYMNLGSHKLKYKYKTSTTVNGQTDSDTEKGKLRKGLPVSMIGLSIGIRF
jgi:opacity protein-like surface antigen